MATNLLRISDAASLGLHAMALLGKDEAEDGWVSAARLAGELKVSEAHLAKVMRRLGRGGLVRSARGRGGGFRLARPAGDVRLLEIYEAIEGPLDPAECLMDPPICGGRRCVMGRLVRSVNRQVRDRLAETTLKELAEAFAPR